MSDPRVEKLADMLVNYSVGIKPGDKAIIEGNELAKPLITAIYQKVLEAGGISLSVIDLDRFGRGLLPGGFRWATSIHP